MEFLIRDTRTFCVGGGDRISRASVQRVRVQGPRQWTLPQRGIGTAAGACAAPAPAARVPRRVSVQGRRRRLASATMRGGRAFDAVFGSTAEVVSVATAVWLLSQRDIAAVLLVTGALLNAILNRGLKKVIRQERPNAGGEVSRDGMPSSHACSLSFLAASVPLGLGVAPGESVVPWMIILSAAATLFAIGGTYQRVRSGRHTVAQVVAGYAVGTLNAGLWNSMAMPLLIQLSLFRDPALVQAAVAGLLFAGAAVVFYKRIPALRPRGKKNK